MADPCGIMQSGMGAFAQHAIAQGFTGSETQGTALARCGNAATKRTSESSVLIRIAVFPTRFSTPPAARSYREL